MNHLENNEPQDLHYSTNVLPFDMSRVRPGLRMIASAARQKLEAAQKSCEWDPNFKIPSAHLLDLLPSYDATGSIPERELSKMCADASVLALAAIHHEAWTPENGIALFIKLQSVAVQLMGHPALRNQSQDSAMSA